MTTLTMQDEKRIEIIQRVFRDEHAVARAALTLGISERQCYRHVSKRPAQRSANVLEFCFACVVVHPCISNGLTPNSTLTLKDRAEASFGKSQSAAVFLDFSLQTSGGSTAK
jgi:hypothetical protein